MLNMVGNTLALIVGKKIDGGVPFYGKATIDVDLNASNYARIEPHIRTQLNAQELSKAIFHQ